MNTCARPRHGRIQQLVQPSAAEADFVWLVAADPVYAKRYGVKFAESVAAQTKGRAHVHFHVVREPETAPPTAVIEAIQAMLPMVSSERTVPLTGVSSNQRSALFASERFLFLAELLLTDTTPSATGFFRILHGSWEGGEVALQAP
jgi:hypothetical protein